MCVMCLTKGGSKMTTTKSMNALDLVRLTPLMERTSGSPEMHIGLIDGPVATDHPDFAGGHIHEISGNRGGTCTIADSVACIHGTFVAGILGAKRGSMAPAICPDCRLLVRPIFKESSVGNGYMPSATPFELSEAIIECCEAGVHIINLSSALSQPSSKGERELEEALNYSANHGVLIVAAAGNQGTLGSTAITRHSWVIPVTACDLSGRPIDQSNMGSSIGRLGLRAPGHSITSLGAEGRSHTLGGTSVAAPFVTGAIALLWSLFPNAAAAEIKSALTLRSVHRRNAIIPPLLDAWAAYEIMALRGKPVTSLV